MRGICKCGMLLALFSLGTDGVKAQALAESGSMASHSSITARTAKSPAVTNPEKPSVSPHLPQQTGPAPDQKNRQDFEDNAGENAGKVLLRSVPSGAEIFINDLFVGHTPLLLVIAPGRYTIDM